MRKIYSSSILTYCTSLVVQRQRTDQRSRIQTQLSLTISSHLTAAAPVSTSPNSTWIFLLIASQSIFSFLSNYRAIFLFFCLSLSLACSRSPYREARRRISRRGLDRAIDVCPLEGIGRLVGTCLVTPRGNGWVTHLAVTRAHCRAIRCSTPRK